MILGSAAYMSPEQARGKAAERRTDIRIFRCLRYELLTAKSRLTAGTHTLGLSNPAARQGALTLMTTLRVLLASWVSGTALSASALARM